MKTRAKQIDKLRRRSRWDWDPAQRPFFNAKHIRFASHFGSPKYHPRKLDDETKKSNQEFTQDGFELTEGEKKWKEDMERMRKRVEQDPYEAVFGKRFPPFWSPILSPLLRWTGEELGFKTDTPTDTKKSTTAIPKKTSQPVRSELPVKKDRDLDADTPNGQLTNYSYSASTAWDSRTNKTRGQEWNSVSGETKSWVYDPITNRRIQIQQSPAESPAQATKPQSQAAPSSVLQLSVEKRASASQNELRQSIAVPTVTTEATDKTSVYFPSLLNTPVTASPAKTSAITKAPESDLDSLTAEDIRASMRGRQDRAHYSTHSSISRPLTLQPALQRMQTKEIQEPEELDDSAAHESTGDSIESSHVPRNWDTKFKPPTVYMNGRKVEENGVRIQASAGGKRKDAIPAYDPSADKQSRYQRKVIELKRELDLSYEQSTINSEMHVERIRELECALKKARAKDAEKTTGPELIQAEGDFDIANVARFAKNTSKWYKQPSYLPALDASRPTQVARDPVVEKLLAKSAKENGITYREASEKDTNDLLNEMAEKDRQIRESRAGRNPFPDPHSTKVDKEMAEKYKHRPEDTTKLLADYAEQDRQVRESRAGRQSFPDPLSATVDKEMTEKYQHQPEDTAKLLEADAKREKEWTKYLAEKKAGTAKPTTESKKGAADWSIQWAEPPVYKVLAYDSGNDMFSTATTSSNFTPHESPISIQDALSQLYQPARFVPHFAELQKEGYQVIFGTKDLLLFKKREDIKPSLVDHGLVKPSDTQPQPITSLVEPISIKGQAVNPIDGTAATASKEHAKSRSNSAVTPSYVSPGCPNHWTKAESDSPLMRDAKKEHESKRSPRVHREERVFSGRKSGGRQRSELTAEEIELLRKLKGNGSGWASRLRWALGVGVGASAVAYGVGVAVEKKEIRDRERWEEVLEGKYGRRSS